MADRAQTFSPPPETFHRSSAERTQAATRQGEKAPNKTQEDAREKVAAATAVAAAAPKTKKKTRAKKGAAPPSQQRLLAPGNQLCHDSGPYRADEGARLQGGTSKEFTAIAEEDLPLPAGADAGSRQDRGVGGREAPYFTSDAISYYKIFSDKNGYKHIHYVKDSVKNAVPITSGPWEAIYIYRVTDDAIFYSSNEFEGYPGRRNIYKINLQTDPPVKQCITCNLRKERCQYYGAKFSYNANYYALLCYGK
uniref:Uncharacterized protein n=1 Tax=Sphaerodactylus townsendi TaxID=933632 RepID=A0ACB8G123_9SAUR